MKISVNCPSYRRPKVETLAYLPFIKVWVDEGEHDSYLKANPGFESNIVSCKKGIQGNVARIRNHILRTELNNGYDVVVIMDDDTQGVFYYYKEGNNAYEKKRVEANNFLIFIEKYTTVAKEMGAKLWGLNNTDQKLFIRQFEPFSTKRFVGAHFSCFLQGNDCFYDENIPLKEEMDMMFQQLNKHRVVFRINNYFCKHRLFTNAGGCQLTRSMDEEIRNIKLLRKKWGNKLVNVPKNPTSYKDFFESKIMNIPIKGV